MIGPNSVTQLITAMREREFTAKLDALFTKADVIDWLFHPPVDMVDETQVARLHRTVRSMFSRQDSYDILRRAGELTGTYILKHRIPKIVQIILKHLPHRLAADLLTKSILAHAWTFAGTGHVKAIIQNDINFVIYNNPLCRDETALAPVCAWHSAVFATLYRELITPNIQAQEITCRAVGAETCRFQISY
jgi:divinyl protochlorophyllide a 8-vinyl-reductase